MSDLTTVQKLRNAARGTILVMERREANAMSELLCEAADYIEAMEEEMIGPPEALQEKGNG